MAHEWYSETHKLQFQPLSRIYKNQLKKMPLPPQIFHAIINLPEAGINTPGQIVPIVSRQFPLSGTCLKHLSNRRAEEFQPPRSEIF